mgnify:CR=1 FL=1
MISERTRSMKTKEDIEEAIEHLKAGSFLILTNGMDFQARIINTMMSTLLWVIDVEQNEEGHANPTKLCLDRLKMMKEERKKHNDDAPNN